MEDDHDEDLSLSLRDALIVSLAAAMADSASKSAGREEDALARCRLTIERDLSGTEIPLAELSYKVSPQIMDMMMPILDLVKRWRERKWDCCGWKARCSSIWRGGR